MATPVANSVGLTNNATINGLAQGGAWAFDNGPRVLTYTLNINDSETSPGNPVGGTWAQYPAIADAVARAFSAWSNVANLSFTSLGTGGIYFDSTADIAVTLTGSDLYFPEDPNDPNDEPVDPASIGFFPDPNFGDAIREASQLEGFSYPRPEGDIFLDNELAAFSALNVAEGGLGFTYIVHEIGHALGLKHPHDDGANARPTFVGLGIGNLDTSANTIMGEAAIQGSGDIASGNVATPMPLDIVVIQHIYGANTNYRTGNDVYALEEDGIVQTLWDAGGIDVLDASALDLPSQITIDLRQGAMSAHGDNSKTYIAFNVTIENAIGSLGADIIHGNDSDNMLHGGTGENAELAADQMFGHGGNDTYIVDSTSDVVTEAAAEGDDTIESSVSYTLPNNVERLTLSGTGNLSATGNSSSNVLTGNAGNNILDGNGGADVLDGGAGDDTYILRSLDITMIDESGFDEIVTFVESYNLPSGFEILRIGSGFDIVVGYGNSVDNYLYANGLGQELHGFAGNDRLYGNLADDRLEGGPGIDTLYGGDSADILLGQDDDDRLEGEAGDDLIFAGAGADVVLGGAGADRAWGENGDDLIFGGADNDSLLGEFGADRLWGEDGDDDLFGGVGDDQLIGEAGNDRLFGDVGADDLFGGDGLDLLLGENDDDRLFGGNDPDDLFGQHGNDLLLGENGNDRLWGGSGTDLLFGQAGDDLLQGEDDNDRLFGGDGNDLLFGQAGDDELQGEADDDRLFGGAGSDHLFGQAGADELQGEDDDDFLYGGDGADVLWGQGGNDVLYGEAGADRFVFTQGGGADIVADFQDGTDLLDLRFYTGATFGNTSIAAQGAHTLVTFTGGESALLIGIDSASIGTADLLFA